MPASMSKFDLKQVIAEMEALEGAVIIKAHDDYVVGRAAIIGVLDAKRLDKDGKTLKEPSPDDTTLSSMIVGNSNIKELIKAGMMVFHHVLEVVDKKDPKLFAELTDAILTDLVAEILTMKEEEIDSKRTT
jgi:hypothetical protein